MSLTLGRTATDGQPVEIPTKDQACRWDMTHVSDLSVWAPRTSTPRTATALRAPGLTQINPVVSGGLKVDDVRAEAQDAGLKEFAV